MSGIMVVRCNGVEDIEQYINSISFQNTGRTEKYGHSKSKNKRFEQLGQKVLQNIFIDLTR